MTSQAVTTAGFDGWEWILIFVLVWLIFRHIDTAEERLRRDLRPREERLREIEAEADMKQWQAQMRNARLDWLASFLPTRRNAAIAYWSLLATVVTALLVAVIVKEMSRLT